MPAEIELHDAIPLLHQHLAIEHVRPEIHLILDAVEDEDRALWLGELCCRDCRTPKLGVDLAAGADEAKRLRAAKGIENPYSDRRIRRADANLQLPIAVT